MPRWARLLCALLVAFVASASAQPAPRTSQSDSSANDAQSKADKQKEALARRQAALALLDLVFAGSRNLTLPQNRIAIASGAFPLLWNRNEAQARALVAQIAGDFAEAASRQQENPEPNSRPMLHQQWQIVVRIIAQGDTELALSFLDATHSFVQFGNPEQDEAEARNLRLELASQEAARNPRNALLLAEKDLQAPGDLPFELVNLITQISARDPEAGAKLLHEVVSRLRGATLASADGNFNFAINLLSSQVNSTASGTPPDESLKSLAESIASAALSPEFPPQMLPMAQNSIDVIQQLAPGRAEALRQKLDSASPAQNPEQGPWDKYNEAQQSGDPGQLLAVVEQAPDDVRSNMFQQVAWQFANSGDLQRARQVAGNLPEFQREPVLQQAIRQSIANAANQGNFAAARQLIQEITSDVDRATALAQLAANAANAKQGALASQMLDDAGALLLNCPPGSATFSAQLQVAQAFALLKPARTLPLLERSVGQLEQVLTAAASIDAFLPYQRSFEGGELILNGGFLVNLLVRPYAEAVAQLGTSDFATARMLADRLPLPEARLLAELTLVRNTLGNTDTSTIVRATRTSGYQRWISD